MLTRISAPQISEKLSQLQARRQETADKWQEKMDWLQLGEGARPCQEGLGLLNPVVSRLRPGILGMEFKAPALGSALCSCFGAVAFSVPCSGHGYSALPVPL